MLTGEVVEEDMMTPPLQLSSQCLHNSRSKASFRCVTVLSSVYLKLREVAIVTISKDLYLYVPLCWLQRHVLFERRPPLEFYHSLINSNFLVDSVEASELVVDEGAHFSKPIVLR